MQLFLAGLAVCRGTKHRRSDSMHAWQLVQRLDGSRFGGAVPDMYVPPSLNQRYDDSF